MNYIRSFFEPVKTYDYAFESYKKIPVLINVKDNKKTVMSLNKFLNSDKYEYDNESNFAVFPSRDSGFIVFDFDSDKPGKVNGLEWFESKFGPVVDNFGLVTKTPSGGIHAYCRYYPDFNKTSIGITLNESTIALDIISSDLIVFQGRHYDVIKNEPLMDIPKKFMDYYKLNLERIKAPGSEHYVMVNYTLKEIDIDDSEGEQVTLKEMLKA